MADRLFRRLAPPPQGAPLPSHPPRAPRSVPLIPLLGACLIVVAVLQGVKLLYEASAANAHPFNTDKGSVAAAVSRLAVEGRGGDLTPIRVNAEVYPHNLQFGATGTAAPPHTVVVFTDPTCGPCRARVASWLKDTSPYGLRVVYKYWPSNRGDTSGGILLEIARRNNLAPKLLQKMEQYPTDIPAEQMAKMLDTLGLDLNTQHDLTIKQAEDLTSTVGQDIAQATTIGLGEPPQAILDGYLLDGRILSPARIPLYITRLNHREAIIQANDYWLNGGQ